MTRNPASRVARQIAAIFGASATIFAACLAPVAAEAVSSLTTASPFGRAVEIAPPPQESSTGRDDGLAAISCPRTGECTAGGTFIDQQFHIWPMVTSLTFGGWGPLREVQLPDNLEVNQSAAFNGISCAAPGSCVGVGSYRYGSAGHLDGFVVAQVTGIWRAAFAPLLPANAAKPLQARLEGVACTGALSCVAVGDYRDKAGNTQLMVVTENAGVWGRAREIAAPPRAKTPEDATASGVSCFRTGGCVAVGGYVGASGTLTPLTFRESGGLWKRAAAIGLPASAQTGKTNGAGLSSVSCTAAGLCAAVGSYLTRSGTIRPMALTGSKGLAGRASQVTAVPSAAGKHPYITELNSVSCVSARLCVAVGDFERAAGGTFQAMALTWMTGRWGGGQKILLPFDADTTSMQIAILESVSCTRQGFCAAAGEYVYVPNVNGDESAMVAVTPHA